MMKFAEVLVPLPLYSTFTYAVSEEMVSQISVGSRVLVQFGAKKYYTGIVEVIHSNPPQGYEVKPIMAVLDSEPIVVYPQLKFWRWIADYYLCSPGDVYKAAIPTGLKPESETFISINPDYEWEENLEITEIQAMVVGLLQTKKRLRISEIETELNHHNLTPAIHRLMEKGIVEINERVIEKYKPKKVAFVNLNIERGDQNQLQEAFSLVKRSAQQERLLMTFLKISGWLNKSGELKSISKDQLMSEAGCSPAILKALVDKGIFSIEKQVVNKYYAFGDVATPKLANLSDAQNTALTQIKDNFNSKAVILLHGLTGSGKTEVYTHLIAEALALNKNVLYLVPEISLTTQLTDRLRKVFGDRLLIYHSKFSDGERVEVWKRMMQDKQPRVLLGVRSSIFLPFKDLGLIIVDEEHESSYKQYDPAPRYNARDAAIMLASMHGAKILLGSATPSVETYYKAKSGKYGLVSLEERFEGAVLPDVEIVNMSDQRKRKLNVGSLSQPLIESCKEAISSGKQAIIFQNRRGFAPVVVCKQCGWVPKCHNCDVSLVFHKSANILKCHYCGFTQSVPKLCPACGQNTIDVFGYGTERIAEEVQETLGGCRVSRMDLETTRNKDRYQEIIDEFASHKTDVLVGTQMVSKGLDFEKVNVVGVINADTMLNFPDFRSSERAFNMLEQVSGRAGRRKEKGSVFIQTFQADNPILEFVKNHDYIGFYESELKEREKFKYPPFTRIINVYIKNKDAEKVDKGAVIFANALKNSFGDRIFGPEKPFVSRVSTWYIRQIMIKVEVEASLKKVKDLLLAIFASISHLPEIKTSMIYYDVDPV